MKFFMVTCNRGHCGCGHSTEIKFAISAATLLEACDKARKMPSVKHTRAIFYGREITEQEYNDYRQVSAYERFEHTSTRMYKESRRR